MWCSHYEVEMPLLGWVFDQRIGEPRCDTSFSDPLSYFLLWAAAGMGVWLACSENESFSSYQDIWDKRKQLLILWHAQQVRHKTWPNHWNKNALYLMEKKYFPLVLFCKHLDSFSVSPSAKQKSHWHSHNLWFDPHMFQSAKTASSKNVLWLTKHELLGYAKEKVLHICNCTLVILIFNVC